MTKPLHDWSGQAEASATAIRDLAALQIIEVAATPRGTIVSARAHSLEPRIGMRLAVVPTQEIWEIRGLAFVPPAAVESGLWGLLLSPVEHEHPLPNRAKLVVPQEKDL